VEIYREALPLLQQGGEIWVLEVALTDLGFIALLLGEYRTAHKHFADCLGTTRASGHRIGEALALNFLGWLALMQADYTTARVRLEESLALARSVGAPSSWHVLVRT
jgi:hypothetical protein